MVMSKASSEEIDLHPNPKKVRKALGANLKKLRSASKMQQMALACDAKLELSTVSALENGKSDCGISTLARIRKTLHVPWEDILSGV